jgi:hypothetical protein
LRNPGLFFLQCSRTCGYGRKARLVTCIDNHGNGVIDKYCNAQPKPAQFFPCFEVRCPPKWKFGDWSEVCIDSKTIRALLLFIKYLRYNARSDWSNVCNMSVYMRGSIFSASACTVHRLKIFYKSYMRWILAFVC